MVFFFQTNLERNIFYHLKPFWLSLPLYNLLIYVILSTLTLLIK